MQPLPLTLSRVPKKSSLKFCITFLVVATLSNFSLRVYIKTWLWCYSMSMQLQVRDQGNILKSSGSTAAESLLKELQPCLAFNKLCSSVRPVSIFTVGSQSKFRLKTHIQQIYILSSCIRYKYVTYKVEERHFIATWLLYMYFLSHPHQKGNQKVLKFPGHFRYMNCSLYSSWSWYWRSQRANVRLDKLNGSHSSYCSLWHTVSYIWVISA